MWFFLKEVDLVDRAKNLYLCEVKSIMINDRNIRFTTEAIKHSTNNYINDLMVGNAFVTKLIARGALSLYTVVSYRIKDIRTIFKKIRKQTRLRSYATTRFSLCDWFALLTRKRKHWYHGCCTSAGDLFNVS